MGHVDRSGARRLTRAAQGAGLVLALCVAGAFMLEPGLPRAPEAFEAPPVESGPGPRETRATIIETSAVGGALDTVAGIVPSVEIEPTPDPVESDPVPLAEGTSPVRYLGGMFEPGGRALAIVSVNGSQRLVRTGGVIAETGLEVISIESGSIGLGLDGEAIERVERAEPTGPLVGVVNPAAAEAVEALTSVAPGTEISEAARERLARQAAAREAAGGSRGDREKFQADYQRRRMELLERYEREHEEDQ